MGLINDVQQYVRSYRQLPAPAVPDKTQLELRADRYGSLIVQPGAPTKHQVADEGAYFCATNPTPGTAVAYGSAGTQAAFSDTVPFMVFKNKDVPSSPGGGKRIYLDYIKLIQIGGTAPATTTSVQAAVKLDSKDRTETAGTAVRPALICPNMDVGAPNPVTDFAYFTGAVATLPAAGPAARLVGRAQLKGGPTLVLDEHLIVFGPGDQPAGGGYLTTVAGYCTRMPPVVIGPQQTAVVHLWFPGGATNPFSYEFEVGLFER